MFEPRRWQSEALKFWINQFSGVVSVVTGGGKTIFAELCMEEFFKKFPSGIVIIIVPTLALLDQWYVSLIDEFLVLQEDISIFSGEEKSKHFKKYNLIVINTARTITLPTEFPKMLVVDECHRSGSIENSRALKPNCVATLGLSATPKRQYDAGFEEKIEPILGKIIYEYTYNEAIKDGVICPFDLVNVEIELLEDEQTEYNKFNKRLAIEFSKGNVDFEKIRILLQKRAIVSSTASMRIPIVAKLIDSHKSQRIIVFFERVSQVDQLYDILTHRNKSVTKYHSKMPPLIRRENLRLFRKAVYDILLTCKALDEGLNVPDASIAIIGSSTSSIRQRIQRMGRVLRPYPGKETALIYTVYATESERKHILIVDNDLDSSVNTTWLKGVIV